MGRLCFSEANLCGYCQQALFVMQVTFDQCKTIPATLQFSARITIDKVFARDGVVRRLLMPGRIIYLLLFGFASLLPSLAEPAAPQQPLSIYIVRTGEQLQSPHVLTYHMVEYARMQGRWIVPDVGYYDAGRWNDQQWFAGMGAQLVRSRHATWTQEFYLAQEAGTAAHNKRSLWVWPVLDLRFKPRLTSQVVVLPMVPLDQAARWSLNVDRAKLEYALRPRFQAGAGYSSSKSATSKWMSDPFLTATMTNRTGAWEFWLQRTQGGAQIQMRYQLVHASR
jgi:hypothetical protein